MKLILNREKSNPTCTLGHLYTDDERLNLCTKEARLPPDRESYIMWLLPPKTYKIHVESCLIRYKKQDIRAYWPVFGKVPWFPKVGFYTGTAFAVRKGRVKLGTSVISDYDIDGDDDACQQMAVWAKAVYEEIGQEEFEFEILQDEENMEFSDISEQDFLKAELAEKEKAEEEALTNELYGTSTTENGAEGEQ